MTIVLKSIAVILFLVVAGLGVTFALGIPLNFVM
jgi:hypothetical protein